MPSSPIHPTALGNNMHHRTLSRGTRNHGQDPAIKTQVLESPKALPITENELPSMVVRPPCWKPPMVRPPSLSVHVAGVEPSCTE